MPRYDKCLYNGSEYLWKNSLKNVESDDNKILYETLLDFFLQRNGTYFLNKPRMCTHLCLDLRSTFVSFRFLELKCCKKRHFTVPRCVLRSNGSVFFKVLSSQAHSYVFQCQRQANNRSIRAQAEIPAFHSSK